MNFKFTKKKALIFIGSLVAFSTVDTLFKSHIVLWGMLVVIFYLARMKDES